MKRALAEKQSMDEKCRLCHKLLFDKEGEPKTDYLVLLKNRDTHNIVLGEWCSEECFIKDKVKRELSKNMKTFIAIEIGNSAYTEFKMKNKEFEQTEDGIFLGRVKSKDEKDALKKIKLLEWNKSRVFDEIVLFEIKD